MEIGQEYIVSTLWKLDKFIYSMSSPWKLDKFIYSECTMEIEQFDITAFLSCKCSLCINLYVFNRKPYSNQITCFTRN